MHFWNRKKTLMMACFLKYEDDDYSQGYGQIQEAFRVLPKDDIVNT